MQVIDVNELNAQWRVIIGRHIQAHMVRTNLSVEHVSRETGLGTGTVSRVANGKGRLRNAQAILLSFNMDVARVMATCWNEALETYAQPTTEDVNQCATSI